MTSIDFDALDDRVFALLFERAEAGEISDTALTNLAKLATSREERRRIEAERAKEDVADPTPLEIVREAPNLPTQKKAALLMEYACELRAELNEVELELGGMGGD